MSINFFSEDQSYENIENSLNTKSIYEFNLEKSTENCVNQLNKTEEINCQQFSDKLSLSAENKPLIKNNFFLNDVRIIKCDSASNQNYFPVNKQRNIQSVLASLKSRPDYSISIQSIAFKCDLIRRHTLECRCLAPRLHTFLLENHRCSSECSVAAMNKDASKPRSRKSSKPMKVLTAKDEKQWSLFWSAASGQPLISYNYNLLKKEEESKNEVAKANVENKCEDKTEKEEECKNEAPTSVVEQTSKMADTKPDVGETDNTSVTHNLRKVKLHPAASEETENKTETSQVGRNSRRKSVPQKSKPTTRGENQNKKLKKTSIYKNDFSEIKNEKLTNKNISSKKENRSKPRNRNGRTKTSNNNIIPQTNEDETETLLLNTATTDISLESIIANDIETIIINDDVFNLTSDNSNADSNSVKKEPTDAASLKSPDVFTKESNGQNKNKPKTKNAQTKIENQIMKNLDQNVSQGIKRKFDMDKLAKIDHLHKQICKDKKKKDCIEKNTPLDKHKTTLKRSSDSISDSDDLENICTNKKPSISDIFGELDNIKEEPIETKDESDMSIKDFDMTLKISLKSIKEEKSDRKTERKNSPPSKNLESFEDLINDEKHTNTTNSDGEASPKPLHIDESLTHSTIPQSEASIKPPSDTSSMFTFSLAKCLAANDNSSKEIVTPNCNNKSLLEEETLICKISSVSSNKDNMKELQESPKIKEEPTDTDIDPLATPDQEETNSSSDLSLSSNKEPSAQNDNTKQSSKKFECNYCMKIYDNFAELAQHLDDHQQDGLILCLFCQKSFGDRTGMKRHMRIHTGERPYECKICGKRFSLPGNFKKHRDIHEDKRTEPCNVCGKTFRRKEHLKYHMRTHTGEKPFQCLICNATYTARYTLQIHMNIHLGKKPYKCHYCTKAFSDKSTMRKHIRIHTGEKPFKCQDCGRCFGESGTLIAHTATHRTDRPFECSKCSLTFKTSGGLRQHDKIHTGKKQYSCKHCGMEFLQKYNMTMHERIHTGERPHKCDECGRSFRSKSCLAKHAVLHAGNEQRKYECSHCDHKFYRKSHLKRHINVHLGIKDYQCEICEKRFTTKIALRNHTNVFHTEGARKFPCKWCGKVFKRQVYISTHHCPQRDENEPAEVPSELGQSEINDSSDITIKDEFKKEEFPEEVSAKKEFFEEPQIDSSCDFVPDHKPKILPNLTEEPFYQMKTEKSPH